jgi:hypothetical protein
LNAQYVIRRLLATTYLAKSNVSATSCKTLKRDFSSSLCRHLELALPQMVENQNPQCVALLQRSFTLALIASPQSLIASSAFAKA